MALVAHPRFASLERNHVMFSMPDGNGQNTHETVEVLFRIRQDIWAVWGLRTRIRPGKVTRAGIESRRFFCAGRAEHSGNTNQRSLNSEKLRKLGIDVGDATG